MRRQQGTTTVEVAIVGLVVMVLLFGVIEIARVFFVFNALNEATRRGARVAAVCQLNDPAIAEITVFNPSGGGAASSLVPGLTTGNVVVEYLDQGGNVLGDPVGSFGFIQFVRVSIAGFTHQLIIPLFTRTFTTPNFATAIPAESLGVWPGGFSPC
ncbi:MAG: pilus assembly protein [Gammaproteobacteria bacterium]|nr:MAG: pilus assembly protein [Gammaproteobacteria bacterium]